MRDDDSYFQKVDFDGLDEVAVVVAVGSISSSCCCSGYSSKRISSSSSSSKVLSCVRMEDSKATESTESFVKPVSSQ